MSKRKSIAELQNQLNKLKEEVVITEKQNEDLKVRFCEEIKKTKPENIKNTIFVEKKYTLWERMKKVLGIN
jgi:deoxyribodipyrimidine photolyase